MDVSQIHANFQGVKGKGEKPTFTPARGPDCGSLFIHQIATHVFTCRREDKRSLEDRPNTICTDFARMLLLKSWQACVCLLAELSSTDAGRARRPPWFTTDMCFGMSAILQGYFRDPGDRMGQELGGSQFNLPRSRV